MERFHFYIRESLRERREFRKNRALIEKAIQNLDALFAYGKPTSDSPYLQELVNSQFGDDVTFRGIREIKKGKTTLLMNVYETKFHHTYYLEDYLPGKDRTNCVFTLDSWSKDLSVLAVHVQNGARYSTRDPNHRRSLETTP
ncbi:MAG: hypothetical protein M1514_02105 [Patescibacteria group bacterium]|nr:hypothetical protein [Patescibacteria group bacterium]